MSTFVDIHLIQSLPPSCVNRDDSGSPKSALYGGVRRLRVSSPGSAPLVSTSTSTSMLLTSASAPNESLSSSQTGSARSLPTLPTPPSL